MGYKGGVTLNFDLDDEQQMLVTTVRGFVEKELYPHEALVDKLNAVPAELRQDIVGKALELGLYAANMPAEHGGGGLDDVAFTLMERELGRASWALQWIVARPSNILKACHGEQIERYLVPCIRGEKVDCLALTEPNAGSDVRSMQTRAVRDGADWIINGAKQFISNADIADFVILFVATGEEPSRRGSRKRISTFLVDRDTPGFDIRLGNSSVSHRGYHHGELAFSDCRVPASAMLGEEGHGFELANEWLGPGRLTVAACSVGRCYRVIDMAAEWAATRRQFGQTIGKFQGVSFTLADMLTGTEAANLLTLQAAWRCANGRMSDTDAAMCKVFATEVLARVTDDAVQIFGGMGLMDSLPIERFWRDARVERIWEGTSEIQRHIISRAMLRPLERD